MSAIFQPAVSDIVAVVPAVRPAWVYLVSRWEIKEENGSFTKEWSDHVLSVLAYGFIPRLRPRNWSSVPCYLVDDPDENAPSWLAAPVGIDDKIEKDLLVRLCHTQPLLGSYQDPWLNGYSYRPNKPDEILDFQSSFNWIA